MIHITSFILNFRSMTRSSKKKFRSWVDSCKKKSSSVLVRLSSGTVLAHTFKISKILPRKWRPKQRSNRLKDLIFQEKQRPLVKFIIWWWFLPFGIMRNWQGLDQILRNFSSTVQILVMNRMIFYLFIFFGHQYHQSNSGGCKVMGVSTKAEKWKQPLWYGGHESLQVVDDK